MPQKWNWENFYFLVGVSPIFSHCKTLNLFHPISELRKHRRHTKRAENINNLCINKKRLFGLCFNVFCLFSQFLNQRNLFGFFFFCLLSAVLQYFKPVWIVLLKCKDVKLFFIIIVRWKKFITVNYENCET